MSSSVERERGLLGGVKEKLQIRKEDNWPQDEKNSFYNSECWTDGKE